MTETSGGTEVQSGSGSDTRPGLTPAAGLAPAGTLHTASLGPWSPLSHHKGELLDAFQTAYHITLL